MCKRSVPRGLRFAILQKTIRRQMDEYVRETGLTGTQVGVLGELGRLERESAGEVTQKALEAAAHVTHPTMAELLKKLEKKGFVTCRTSEKDHRCKVVSATERAHELHHAIGVFDDCVFTALCRGLSEGEIAEFLRITDVMLENAKKVAASGQTNLVIRVPTVPGFNDTVPEITAIAKFAASLPGVTKIHLLPYHRLGQDKYTGLNRPYLLDGVLPPGREHMEALADAVRAATDLNCQIGG